MGFPRTVANVACRALVDFLVPIAGGVIFVFCRFGEGELFSSEVDDESSSFSALFVCSISVWRLIPLVVCSFLVGFPLDKTNYFLQKKLHVTPIFFIHFFGFFRNQLKKIRNKNRAYNLNALLLQSCFCTFVDSKIAKKLHKFGKTSFVLLSRKQKKSGQKIRNN